jgi:predicted O-methyltransferase YrrM
VTDLMGVPGLISVEAGRVLQGLAASIPSHLAIVELGSYRGRSTAYLAAGARRPEGVERAPVYAVDAWSPDVAGWSREITPATVDEFRANLAGVGLGSHVIPVQGLTTDAGRNYAGPPVGLLFIDADHTCTAALADFGAWRDHLAVGAHVVWDDFGTRNNPGVGAAVAELLHGRRLRLADVAADRLAICQWRGST